MNSVQDDAIRTRAHQIWEQEGRPDGREMDHWEAAERELSNGGLGQPDARDEREDSPGLGFGRGTSSRDTEALKGDGSINPNGRGRTNK